MTVCLHVYLCALCMQCLLGKNRVLDPLELGWQIIVSCCVGARNQTLVPCKSSQYSWLYTLLSSGLHLVGGGTHKGTLANLSLLLQFQRKHVCLGGGWREIYTLRNVKTKIAGCSSILPTDSSSMLMRCAACGIQNVQDVSCRSTVSCRNTSRNSPEASYSFCVIDCLYMLMQAVIAKGEWKR